MAEESNEDNFLMLKPQYALSYSRERGTPNWGSYRTTVDAGPTE